MPSAEPVPKARWCEEHGRLECTRQRSKGRGQCHGLAFVGLDVCRMHAGMSGEMAKVRGQALSAFSSLGTDERIIDPKGAVMAMLQVSWLRAHLYAGMLADQLEADSDSDGYGLAVAGESGGLIGHVVDGTTGKATSEAVRALVALEGAERDKVVRYSEVGHRMGIEEWQTAILDGQAEQLVRVIRAALSHRCVTIEGDASVVVLDALKVLEVER